MKLTRNTTPDGRGKYALVRLDKLRIAQAGDGSLTLLDLSRIEHALYLLEKARLLEYGQPSTPEEFFVIKLKDKHADFTLRAYAASVASDDKEFAEDVRELSSRAANHPNQKQPD